jgi:secreted Zn-dependent insulinase-like peptidase
LNIQETKFEILKADLLESLELAISADPYKESLKVLKKTLKNNIFREKERIDALKSLTYNEFKGFMA